MANAHDIEPLPGRRAEVGRFAGKRLIVTPSLLGIAPGLPTRAPIAALTVALAFVAGLAEPADDSAAPVVSPTPQPPTPKTTMVRRQIRRSTRRTGRG